MKYSENFKTMLNYVITHLSINKSCTDVFVGTLIINKKGQIVTQKK